MKKYLIMYILLIYFITNTMIIIDANANIDNLNVDLAQHKVEKASISSELTKTKISLTDSESKLKTTEHKLQTVKTKLADSEKNNKELSEEIYNMKSDADFIYDGEFTITYYCGEDYPHVCASGNGVTSSGAKAFSGVTVAADPNVLPEGTYIYIEGVGMRVVQDIGGAIKGNRIDIYVDTHKEALSKNVVEASVWHIGKDD